MFCWCYSFFNCLGELISESIWVWSFLHGKIKIFNRKKQFFKKKSYYIALSVIRASLKVIFSVGPGVVMAALKIPS